MPDQGGSQSEEKYKIVVGGKTLELTMPELIAMAQQGQDYTQKTQALSQKEKDLAALTEAQANKMFEAWLSEIAASQAAEPSVSDASAGVPDQATAKELAAIRKEMEELRGLQRSSESNRVTAEIDGLMKELKKKYPHMNRLEIEDRFMREAGEHENPYEVFDRFAKESEAEYGKSRQAIIDEYVKEKSNPQGSAGETGAAGGASGTPESKEPPKSFDEARERGERLFEALRGKAPVI